MCLWQIITRTQSHVIFNLSNLYFFYSINDSGTIQSCKVVFNFFFFFGIKISGDSTSFIQKERCLEKAPKNLFFESTLNFPSLSHWYNSLCFLR